MSRALIVINSVADRQKICRWANQAPWATRVEWKSPKRSLDQNAKMWVLLTEVAEQLPWHGKKMPADSWKLMFLDALKRSKQQPLDIVPNTDGTGFVNLSTSSSDLGKDEMAELIELVMAFGAEHGVIFQDPTQPSDVAAPSPDDGRDVDVPITGDVAATLSEDTAETETAPPEAPAPEAQDGPDAAASPAEFECIKKMLALATDKALTKEELGEELAIAADRWIGTLPDGRAEFVRSVFTTARQVAKGTKTPADAKTHLEGLVA